MLVAPQDQATAVLFPTNKSGMDQWRITLEPELQLNTFKGWEEGEIMAKKSSSTGKRKVHKVMKEHKEGKLKSGSGKKVKSRKQAVAIALNEARESGAKIPKKKEKSS
jgi:hypothetical protein